MSEQTCVILLCGRIGSGKTTYAQMLCREKKAVLLSSDVLTLALTERGVDHDLVAGTVHEYLFSHSLDLLYAGVSVILDWGFWTRQDRLAARRFYEERGIPCVLHYVSPSDTQWEKNIAMRNRAVQEGRTKAFYVDDGLLEKCILHFEVPQPEEVDVYYRMEEN